MTTNETGAETPGRAEELRRRIRQKIPEHKLYRGDAPIPLGAICLQIEEKADKWVSLDDQDDIRIFIRDRPYGVAAHLVRHDPFGDLEWPMIDVRTEDEADEIARLIVFILAPNVDQDP